METIDDPDEPTIVERARSGDQAAFAQLFRRYHLLVRSIAARVAGNGNADEVAQEAFIDVWKKIGTYDASKGRFLGWLVTITRRRALDFVRRHSSYSRAVDRYEVSLGACPKRDGHPLLYGEEHGEHVGDRDRNLLLREALSRLPPLQARVVRLTIEGRSQRELARMLSTPLGTIKTQLELAHRKLAGFARARRHEFV